MLKMYHVNGENFITFEQYAQFLMNSAVCGMLASPPKVVGSYALTPCSKSKTETNSSKSKSKKNGAGSSSPRNINIPVASPSSYTHAYNSSIIKYDGAKFQNSPPANELPKPPSSWCNKKLKGPEDNNQQCVSFVEKKSVSSRLPSEMYHGAVEIKSAGKLDHKDKESPKSIVDMTNEIKALLKVP